MAYQDCLENTCNKLENKDSFWWNACEYGCDSLKSAMKKQSLIMHAASLAFIENRYNNKLVECGQAYWECTLIIHKDEKDCPCPDQAYDP
jgi:hypothetical protein